MPYTASNRRNRSLMTLPRWGQKVLLLAIIPVPQILTALGLSVNAYISLDCKVIFFLLLEVVRFFSPFMIWDWKRVIRVPNLIIHYVNVENLGLAKGGPYSGLLCFVTRSDTGSPLYAKKRLIYSIPRLINRCPSIIKYKFLTHSFHGFSILKKLIYMKLHSLPSCIPPCKRVHYTKLTHKYPQSPINHIKDAALNWCSLLNWEDGHWRGVNLQHLLSAQR